MGVATLTVQGVRYARLERLSGTGEILTVAINLALGLIIVVLKALLAHQRSRLAVSAEVCGMVRSVIGRVRSRADGSLFGW